MCVLTSLPDDSDASESMRIAIVRGTRICICLYVCLCNFLSPNAHQPPISQALIERAECHLSEFSPELGSTDLGPSGAPSFMKGSL